MTRTIWELLVASARAKRLGPGEYTKRTPHFLPWTQTIREKMWTWAAYLRKD